MAKAKKKRFQVGGNRAVITFPAHQQTGVGTQGVPGQGDRRPRTAAIWGRLLDPSNNQINPVFPPSSMPDGTFTMTFGSPTAPLAATTLYKFQVSFSQNFSTIDDEIDFTT